MRTNSLLGNFEDIEASMDPRKDIEQFINNNYNISDRFRISKEPNKDGKYEVDGWGVVRVIHLTTSTLTNGMFEWREIYGNFECDHCISLTNLEGSPKKVSGSFYCHNCKSLTSLKGAPEKVGRNFICSWCESLISLDGAPKEVGENFDCASCEKLTSLEGAPKKVGGKILHNILYNLYAK